MAPDPFDDEANGRRARWRARPLYALLGAFVLGILAAPIAPLPLLFLIGAMALFAAAGMLFGRHRHLAALCLLTAFALFGTLRAEQTDDIAPNDISFSTGRPSEWVSGVVVSDAEGKPGRAGEGEEYAFTIRVRAVDDYVRTRRAAGLLRVTLFGAEAPPHPGDILWLRGRVALPPAATNPEGFDDRAYLARHGIYATMAVKRAGDLRRVGRAPLSPLTGATFALRGRMEHEARAHLAPDDATLLLGMLAGERGTLPADLEDAFARTGTMHLLTVSGLHIAVAAGMLAWLLGTLTLPRKANRLLCLVAVWLFALAAGGGTVAADLRAPALRAALCATVFLAAPLVRRSAEPRHALAFAALVLLLLDPRALWDPGAQMTFATVGVLVWWMPPLERLVAPWEPGMGRFPRLCRGIVLALMGGIVAQIGSWPLAATHFHLFSLVAPLTNLTLAPLASALFGFGLLLAAAPVLPLWGALAAGLHALRLLALSFAAPEWAAWSVAAPPSLFVVAYYAALFALAAAVRTRVLVPQRLFAPGSVSTT